LPWPGEKIATIRSVPGIGLASIISVHLPGGCVFPKTIAWLAPSGFIVQRPWNFCGARSTYSQRV